MASIPIRSLGRLAAIEPQERADWLRQMRDLWAAGMEPHLPEGSDWPRALWDTVEDWYAEVAYAHVALADGRLVGFQLVSHRHTATHRYVVINATAVRSDLQGSNIGFTLTMRTLLGALRRERSLRFYITSRVFSPVALAGVYEATPARALFFPWIDPGVEPVERLRAAVVDYVEHFYPDYQWDPETSLICGPSEKVSPAFQTRTGEPLIDDWWDAHLADGGASVLAMQAASLRILVGVLPKLAIGINRMIGLRRRGARPHHTLTPVAQHH